MEDSGRIFDEIAAIRAQLGRDSESIQAQLRSMAASIGNNAADTGARLTALEVWRDAHEEKVATRTAFIDGELRELSRGQGVTDAHVVEINSVLDQVKGAGKVWRVVGTIVAVLGGALEAWHVTRH